VRRGATEDVVAKVADYEHSDLPERTKAALRFADRLSAERPHLDRGCYEELKRHLTDDELLDLGMLVMFFSGWQRLIDALGILPDQWRDGDALPFGPLPKPSEG
jgi:alkylhydroperoxidase family enzyme